MLFSTYTGILEINYTRKTNNSKNALNFWFKQYLLSFKKYNLTGNSMAYMSHLHGLVYVIVSNCFIDIINYIVT